MKKTQIIAVLIIGFFAVSFILSTLGLVDVSFNDALNYSIIMLGIGMVYTGFTDDNKLLIFLGSTVFLIGIVFLVQSDFEVHGLEKVTASLVLLVAGSSLFTVFISDTDKKWLLIISLLLWIAGMVFLLIDSSVAAGGFFESIVKVGLKFWYIFFITFFIIFLIDKAARD